VIRRNIEPAVRRALADTLVVLINGARQTGQTTLAQAIAAASGAQYLTLDDATTLTLAPGDPVGFVRNLGGPVVLDEIQKAPDLFPAIKLAVDRDRRPGGFLLTGSANVLAMSRLSESLAGRMEILPLFPFSAGELDGISEAFVGRLSGLGRPTWDGGWSRRPSCIWWTRAWPAR
jgi:predicted AAA+ superfamily ATPase